MTDLRGDTVGLTRNNVAVLQAAVPCWFDQTVYCQPQLVHCFALPHHIRETHVVARLDPHLMEELRALRGTVLDELIGVVAIDPNQIALLQPAAFHEAGHAHSTAAAVARTFLHLDHLGVIVVR